MRYQWPLWPGDRWLIRHVLVPVLRRWAERNAIPYLITSDSIILNPSRSEYQEWGW